MSVLPAEPAQVKAAADRLRELIKRGQLNQRKSSLAVSDWMSNDESVTEWREALTTLYDMLIHPIEHDLKHKRLVGFIPTDYFHYIPMQALAHTEGKRIRFFIEDKTVFYYPASELGLFGQRRDTTELGKGVLNCFTDQACRAGMKSARVRRSSLP